MTFNIRVLCGTRNTCQSASTSRSISTATAVQNSIEKPVYADKDKHLENLKETL